VIGPQLRHTAEFAPVLVEVLLDAKGAPIRMTARLASLIGGDAQTIQASPPQGCATGGYHNSRQHA